MKKFKSLLIIAAVIAVVAIGAIIYTVLFSNPKTEPNIPPVTQNDNQSNNENNNDGDPPGYDFRNNSAFAKVEGTGYSYYHPAHFTEEKVANTYLPYDNQKVPVDTTVRFYIDAEYCAPSGQCKPSTTNFEMESVVINSPL